MQNRAKIQKVVPVKKNGYVLELQVPAPQSALTEERPSLQETYTQELPLPQVQKVQMSPEQVPTGNFMRNLFRR